VLFLKSESGIAHKEKQFPLDVASEAILALQPVMFRYKHELDPDGIPQFGLVATITQLKSSAIKALTASLKEQASQIQKGDPPEAGSSEQTCAPRGRQRSLRRRVESRRATGAQPSRLWGAPASCPAGDG
jgi:hypothetical protein